MATLDGAPDRWRALAPVRGLTGIAAFLPVDDDIGHVLDVRDGQIRCLRAAWRRDGPPHADLIVEGPRHRLDEVLAGRTALLDVVHEMRISGEMWALLSLPPLLHDEYPNAALGRAGAVARLTARAEQAIESCPSTTGFQLYVALPGIEISLARGSTTAGRPMTVDTLHHVRCATKPFLALLAQLLESAGHLDLDLPLAHVEGFENLAASRASLRDALCHDAGLGAPRQVELYFTGPERDRVLRSVASEQPYEVFSEVAAWYVVERAIEQLTGERIEELLPQFLGTPLHGTSFATAPDPLRMGTYFQSIDSSEPPVPLVFDLAPRINRLNSPAFGGLTTAQALGRFYRDTMHGPTTIRAATAAMRSYRRGARFDRVLDREADFCVGFEVGAELTGTPRASADVYGQRGWLGSSWAFADPVRGGLSCAFLHNGFTTAEVNDTIRAAVVEAMYDAAAAMCTAACDPATS